MKHSEKQIKKMLLRERIKLLNELLDKDFIFYDKNKGLFVQISDYIEIYEEELNKYDKEL